MRIICTWKLRIICTPNSLGSVTRNRTVTTVTLTLCRYFDALGNASWSTCEINPGVMGRQSEWRHESGSYKACPNEAVTSLKSDQVAYRHEGDMAGDAMFVPSSGNQGYSRYRTFPFKGTPLRQYFGALGNVNITPRPLTLLILCLDAGDPLLGGPKQTNNCSFLRHRAALWT